MLGRYQHQSFFVIKLFSQTLSSSEDKLFVLRFGLRREIAWLQSYCDMNLGGSLKGGWIRLKICPQYFRSSHLSNYYWKFNNSMFYRLKYWYTSCNKIYERDYISFFIDTKTRNVICNYVINLILWIETDAWCCNSLCLIFVGTAKVFNSYQNSSYFYQLILTLTDSTVLVLSQCKTTSAHEEPRSSGNDCTNILFYTNKFNQ